MYDWFTPNSWASKGRAPGLASRFLGAQIGPDPAVQALVGADIAYSRHGRPARNASSRASVSFAVTTSLARRAAAKAASAVRTASG